MVTDKRILHLMLIMMAVAVAVSGIALSALYQTAIDQQAMRLTETVRSQARLLEAVARFDATFSTEDIPGGAYNATLAQFREAHSRFEGLGATGEFTLARREGDNIVFLLDHRHHQHHESLAPIAFDSDLALPMRRALQGEQGTVIGPDYRGEPVLAAFEPVAELGLGLVAKIDLTEIRTPFLRAGLFVVTATMLLLCLAIILFQRIAHPLAAYLEESEKRLRLVLDTAADGIITITEQGKIESFNQAAERIFGYRADEIMGKQIGLLMPLPIAKKHPRFVQQYLRDSDGPKASHIISAESVMEGRHKSGRTIPIELAISELSVGKQRHFTGIVRDITERKRAEEALSQREEELRLTFENAPMGIYTDNLTGSFLSANRAFCNMLGYSEAELRSKNIRDVTHPDDQPGIITRTQQVLKGEIETYSLEKRFLRRDGSNVSCAVHVSVTHDSSGKPLMRIVHVEDRTQQIKAEQELQEHRERLAHVARMSTMGEMATSIAHEVNQPLSAIATYAQACRRLINSELPEAQEVNQTLEKINTQALRAGEVIQRLRGFIRKRTSERSLVDCNKLVEEVVKLAEVDAKSHGLRIGLELAAQLPPLRVDTVQIQQVILNLIRNALESMQEIPVTERALRLNTSVTSGNQIRISVSDNGPGLLPEEQASMFDPFFTTKESGLGMGLSISRSITNAHNGRLSFCQNPQGGMTFSLELPATEGEGYD